MKDERYAIKDVCRYREESDLTGLVENTVGIAYVALGDM